MSHIHNGIVSYCRQYQIPLTHKAFTKAEVGDGDIWMKVLFRNGVSKLVLFDIGDWPDIAHLDGLDRCDLYVKRSYLPRIVDSLPDQYKKKIIPYGIYFAYATDNFKEEHLASRISDFYCYTEQKFGFFGLLNSLARSAVKRLIHRGSGFLPIKFLEETEGGLKKILYQTRLWNPDNHRSTYSRSIEEINLVRIDLVRKLKKEFGESFVGGIIPDEYSNKVCPDLITSERTDSESYMRLLSQCSIVVADEGLHGSTGSKVGEYFASGRAIVSERLNYLLPHEPIDGQHWKNYSTSDECVTISRDLLNDPEKLKSLMAQAKKFYLEKLSPMKVVEDVISQISC